MATHRYRTRAEALRAAVGEFVALRREEQIDAELEAGYAAVPQTDEERALAAASIDGLQASRLEW